MSPTIIEKLNEYYLNHGIHPQNFRCPNQNFCRSFAHNGKMIETKMSLVGNLYGVSFPKIVVVSLDPPAQEKFKTPKHRTTEYIANITELEDYTINRPNPHWAMTQIIVKDLLLPFGYRSVVGSATVMESYSGRVIENVTPYFAHVNVAKCSMNDPNKRQAARPVHDKCSEAYLVQELNLLEPDILVTQGKSTNEILGMKLSGKSISESDLPVIYKINLAEKSVLWMPMRHPTQQLGKIREDWPYYQLAIQGLSRF